MDDDQPKKLFICDNIDCRARGSLDLADEIQRRLDDDPDGADVELEEYTCFGGCDIGPNMIVYPDRAWYCGVQEADVPELVEHLTGRGPRLERLETADRTTAGFILNILDAGGWGSF
jgi:(2Fe-2S) ferredoxin